MVTSSYWLSEEGPGFPDRASRPAGPIDVAIVGGGVTGCACALALAEAGRRVRVYEAREVAGGASGRNGGFALRGGAPAYDAARRNLGPERAKELWRLTERYLDRLEGLAGDAFRRTGSLRLAADREERSELEAEYEALREDGFEVEWRDELAEPLRGRFDGAIFHPPDGSLQPARWVRRLAARAVEAGAELREHERVESLDELEADHIVVATDGYTQGLLPELDAIVKPTRGQVLVTEPLEPAPVPVPALRQARLRLLAADAGGTARRRGLPRQGAGPRAHRRGAGDAADPGPSRALRERSCSGRRRRSRTVGQGSSARPRTAFRSSVRSPATTTSGSPAATRVTATCSVSLAASSSPRRSSDDRHPGSNCSNPRGC